LGGELKLPGRIKLGKAGFTIAATAPALTTAPATG
jgi:hypothetical protein